MSKKNKVKISKLCLEIDDKKIELTLKQAQELQEILNDTFGGVETVFRDRWHYPYPYMYTGGTCSTLLSDTTTTTSSDLASSTTAAYSTFWAGALTGSEIHLKAV